MNNPTINKLLKLYPRIKLQSGESFYWSPEKELIVYNENLIDKPVGKWALFHEVAHANLGHVNYSSDLGLLKLEVAAWEEAKIIASKFRSEINEDHIQDCLDTYRDWLHRRSSCPTCGIVCMQIATTNYKCHNCKTNWVVSASRFCRPYRLTINQPIEKRLQTKVTTFS